MAVELLCRKRRTCYPEDIYFDRIHAISYHQSLHPNDKDVISISAEKMFQEVTGIQQLLPGISDTAAIREPLQLFLSKWNNPEQIRGSLSDGNQKFMADVTAFYLRGLVQRKGEGKTLFPLFRP